MARDNKYGNISVPGIPEDEPIFVIRAQDKLSVPTLARYRNHADAIEKPEDRRSEEWFADLDKVMEDFQAWQAEHAKQLKLPD
jgi:hypothetical protein